MRYPRIENGVYVDVDPECSVVFVLQWNGSAVMKRSLKLIMRAFNTWSVDADLAERLEAGRKTWAS